MMDINALAAEAHANAVAHGFWDDAADADARFYALIHCELSEAIQAEREGLPLLCGARWGCPHARGDAQCGRYDPLEGCCTSRPDGVAVELADYVIRLLDSAAAHGMEIPERTQDVPEYRTLPRLVNALHIATDNLCAYRDRAAALHISREDLNRLQRSVVRNAVDLVETWLAARGVDLWQVVRAKMDYNRQRPRLHGKRY